MSLLRLYLCPVTRIREVWCLNCKFAIMISNRASGIVLRAELTMESDKLSKLLLILKLWSVYSYCNPSLGFAYSENSQIFLPHQLPHCLHKLNNVVFKLKRHPHCTRNAGYIHRQWNWTVSFNIFLSIYLPRFEHCILTVLFLSLRSEVHVVDSEPWLRWYNRFSAKAINCSFITLHSNKP